MSTGALDINTVHPIGAKILVRLYERPETVGSIILPDAFRKDYTLSCWEVVTAGPRASAVLGTELLPDDIIQTPSMAAVYVDSSDGHDYFMVEAAQVLALLRWK